jgi:thioredoxin-related protein
MRQLIFILSIFTFLGACKQENTTPTNFENFEIPAGEWTWVQSSGGFTGIIQNPDNQNITRHYLFTSAKPITQNRTYGLVMYANCSENCGSKVDLTCQKKKS